MFLRQTPGVEDAPRAPSLSSSCGPGRTPASPKSVAVQAPPLHFIYPKSPRWVKKYTFIRLSSELPGPPALQ